MWLRLFRRKGGLKDGVKLTGVIEITVIGKDGKVKERRRVKNTVTSAGKTAIAQLIVGLRTTPFKYIGIGSGTPSESGLGDPLEYQEATVSADGGASWEATFTADASWSVTEAVICDSSSGGTVLAYQSFSAVNLSAGDQIKINWTLTIS